MAFVAKKLYNGYTHMTEAVDPRTDYMYIIGSPIKALALAFVYLYTVKVLGPKWMEKRKPYNIRNIIIVYNILQIIFNMYVFIKTTVIVLYTDFLCGHIDYSNNPFALDTIHTAYLYFLLKIFDWLDTIFFILKKNYRQTSFLHIYHHAAMFLGMWIGVTYFGGGKGAWLVFINTFVHVIMFAYYLLTAIDTSWKQNIRFKMFLTQVQMVQFAFVTILFAARFFQTDCNYPVFASYVLVPQASFLMILFGDFYWKTYNSGKATK